MPKGHGRPNSHSLHNRTDHPRGFSLYSEHFFSIRGRCCGGVGVDRRTPQTSETPARAFGQAGSPCWRMTPPRRPAQPHASPPLFSTASDRLHWHGLRVHRGRAHGVFPRARAGGRAQCGGADRKSPLPVPSVRHADERVSSHALMKATPNVSVIPATVTTSCRRPSRLFVSTEE